MEIQTNHTLRLLNAKCEYVCIVDNLSKKLDYGDDVECCLNKLFLASKLINRLECYCFTDIAIPETICYNCIEQSDLREMYAVLDNLLS
jgi:hypothetical protein